MQNGFNAAILTTNGQSRLAHEDRRREPDDIAMEEQPSAEERSQEYYQVLVIEGDK